MEITIIGWYGTETLGDRAILAGIFRIISESAFSCSVRLGSLYPFHTERTLYEDNVFYKSISGNKINSISIFDSRNPMQLKKNIKSSSLLMVGGGPLMDLNEMNMLEYAFFYAKKKKIPSLLFGCGWGPLKNPVMIEKAGRLVEMSEYTVFRDELSCSQCLKYFPHLDNKVSSAIDPAVFACVYYLNQQHNPRIEDYIAINFRDVVLEGSHYAKNPVDIETFVDILKTISFQSNIPIKLIPMHSFFIGGDDRVFLNYIKQKANLNNVVVEQIPQSLYQTMDIFYHAKMCVGMRFHSVLFQTILNGNNYILDYTDAQTGKIVGLKAQLEMNDFYDSRYCSLYRMNDRLNIDLNKMERFKFSNLLIEKAFSKYLAVLNNFPS